MINILLISDAEQAVPLRTFAQSRAQVKFIIVSDYDHGLKDVFEKRPSVVFIQEQIAGVTGESVARHIQLLLGDSAPNFVLVHDANSKARPCKGLFEHLLDISQADEDLFKDFEGVMGEILKEEWTSASEDSTKPAEIKDQESNAPAREDEKSDESQNSGMEIIHDIATDPDSAITTFEPPPLTHEIIENEVVKAPPEINSFEDEHKERSAIKLDRIIAPIDYEPAPLPPPAVKNRPEVKPQKKRSSGSKPDSQKQGGILLSEFEANYKKTGTGNNITQWVLIGSLIAAACFAAVSLYLVWSSSSSSSKYLASKQQNIQKPPPDPETEKASTPPPQPVAASPSRSESLQPIPSFVPADGIDSQFSKSHPGWSRYLGKGRDYRIFVDNGKIKALQVISVNTVAISQSELQTAMQELLGISSFSVHSRQETGGLLLERATIGDNGELLAYRTQAGGPLRAFVLTVN